MRHHRLIAALALTALASSGCTYISQSKYEEKKNSLDQDGDGALLGGPGRDCNNHNADMTPGSPEVPYDGIDNDCGDDLDLVDIDGDGFPGITREDYEAKFPDAEWPNNVADGPWDCRDDPSVHAEAVDIFPGNDNDVPYDGIDSDCAGDNDFDVDGDTYLPDRFEIGGTSFDTKAKFDEYVLDWGYDLGTPVYGDCNDFDATVHPGSATADVPYDGVDQDCAGDNDFDVDGDGFMPDEAANNGKYQDFIEQYHEGTAPWAPAPQWGDCLDQAVSSIVDPINQSIPADPASIYPGANDDPYDGLDSDCDGANDFDADGDQFMPASAQTGVGVINYDYYVAEWGYSYPEQVPPRYDDCDDADAEVRPGAQERIDDEVDQDCHGGNDITVWGFDSYMWGSPRQPSLSATDDHYILVAAADYLDDFSGGEPPVHVGVGIAFDKAEELYDASPIGVPVRWQGANNPQPLGASVQGAADGNAYWATTSYVNSANFWNYAVARKVEWDEISQNFIMRTLEYSGIPVQVTGSDIDIFVDPLDQDHPWVVACSPTSVQVMHGVGSIPSPSDYMNDIAFDGGLCFVTSPPFNNRLEVTACGTAGCTGFEFNASAQQLVGPSAQYTPAWYGVSGPSVYSSGDYKGTIHVLTDPSPGGGAWVHTSTSSINILQGHDVESVDASLYNGDLYALAVVDDGGGREVILAYGTPPGLTQVPYPFADPLRPNLVVGEAAIFADDRGVAMAVSAFDPSSVCTLGPASGGFEVDGVCQDAVGWVFLGW